MSAKTGLQIISGLIEELRKVIKVAGSVSSRNNPLLEEVRQELRFAMIPALDPKREKWLREVDQKVGTNFGWLETAVSEVVYLEEKYRYTHDWTTSKIHDRCIDLLERLENFEPIVRREADEARQEILQLLDK